MFPYWHFPLLCTYIGATQVQPVVEGRCPELQTLGVGVGVGVVEGVGVADGVGVGVGVADAIHFPLFATVIGATHVQPDDGLCPEVQAGSSVGVGVGVTDGEAVGVGEEPSPPPLLLPVLWATVVDLLYRVPCVASGSER